LSTLVHEMCHSWQQHFGKPSRTGYHNRQWAAKMIEVGLMPSDTGAEGGKPTGQHMTHYIIDGGAFECAADELLATGFRLNWQSAIWGTRPRPRGKNKVKYTCPQLRAECLGQAGGLAGLRRVSGRDGGAGITRSDGVISSDIFYVPSAVDTHDGVLLKWSEGVTNVLRGFGL
jgi:hypothetical protein